jgi:translocator protein
MQIDRQSLIIIAAITILGQILGGRFSATGKMWYRTLNLPTITPPDWIFGVVWTTIYILTAICVYRVWNDARFASQRTWLVILFAINLILNIGWSYIFFQLHMILGALLLSIALEILTLALFTTIFQTSQWLSLLLLPYVLWGGFAIYLNYLVWILNR